MKVGDRVVYIMRDLPDVGLINGKVYTIQGIAECGGCIDDFCVDVGLETEKRMTYCDKCQNIIHIGPEWYFNKEAFRLVEYRQSSQLVGNLISEAL